MTLIKTQTICVQDSHAAFIEDCMIK